MVPLSSPNKIDKQSSDLQEMVVRGSPRLSCRAPTDDVLALVWRTEKPRARLGGPEGQGKWAFARGRLTCERGMKMDRDRWGQFMEGHI